jgi:hypothetical protein
MTSQWFVYVILLFDWLIVYGFTSRSRIFHLYGNVTTAGEGLQNLGLSRRSGPLSRERSLSCHTYCDTGPRFFRSHPKDCPIQSPLTTCMGMWTIYSNRDPHGAILLFELAPSVTVDAYHSFIFFAHLNWKLTWPFLIAGSTFDFFKTIQPIL